MLRQHFAGRRGLDTAPCPDEELKIERCLKPPNPGANRRNHDVVSRGRRCQASTIDSREEYSEIREVELHDSPFTFGEL
jgi:hypothetical protein